MFHLSRVYFFVSSLLPALLVRLTQISATVAMAAPMLEFLSGKDPYFLSCSCVM